MSDLELHNRYLSLCCTSGSYSTSSEILSDTAIYFKEKSTYEF